MPSTLIIGGAGQLARLITARFISKNWTVHSLIRNEAQVESLTSLGAHPIVQSLTSASVAELASTIRKLTPDIIVFSAGAGAGAGENPELIKQIDQDGAIKTFDAMVDAGTTARLILISALDVRDRSKPAPEWYDEMDIAASEQLWGAIEPYMKHKLAADSELVSRRGLAYTIVRPNWYHEAEGTGLVECGRPHIVKSVARKDVAAVVVACAENEGTAGLAFDVVGGDQPVDEAVAKVARENIDAFKGLY
ncbi:hypothetical protein PVAG01_11408 [Phlyctema vagabunda]|uniref:NAD(P)-binding domain-containing protein n=1 Tax=Phlyctema vagabunda TaxID=108571 RepID=A0ABR4P271_9HELO